MNNIVFENQIVGLPSNTNTCCLSFGTIVLDDIFFEAISMGGHSQGFISEKDTIPAVRTDDVAANKIVRVFVPDGNTELAVTFQNIIFE